MVQKSSGKLLALFPQFLQIIAPIISINTYMDDHYIHALDN